MNIRLPRLNRVNLLFVAGLLLLLAACGDNASKNGGTYTLSLNLPVGEPYYYTTEMEQDVASAGMQMRQEMQFGMVYEMLEPQGQLKRLRVTYDQLKFKAESPMGTVEYDTKQPVSSSPFSAFQEVVGKVMEVEFSADGRVARVSGLEGLLPGGTAQTLGDSSLAKMVTNSFDFFPGKPVAVGDSWEKTASMNMNGISLEVKSTYTLTAVKEGVGTVKMNAAISVPEIQGADQDMQINLTGSQDGEILLDIDKGLVVSGAVRQTIQGELQAGGQKMPMEITGDIRFSATKMQ